MGCSGVVANVGSEHGNVKEAHEFHVDDQHSKPGYKVTRMIVGAICEWIPNIICSAQLICGGLGQAYVQLVTVALVSPRSTVSPPFDNGKCCSTRSQIQGKSCSGNLIRHDWDLEHRVFSRFDQSPVKYDRILDSRR